MDCTKESGDRVKETPHFSDTHDLLRHLLDKRNTHIPRYANLESQNSQWVCKNEGMLHVHILCEHTMIFL